MTPPWNFVVVNSLLCVNTFKLVVSRCRLIHDDDVIITPWFFGFAELKVLPRIAMVVWFLASLWLCGSSHCYGCAVPCIQ